MKSINRREFLRIGGAGIAGLTLSGLNLPVYAKRKRLRSTSANAWKFGVMADTQWRTGNNAGGEPASCATTIIDALNDQFIQHGCKFVVQVGDLVDMESVDGVRSLPTRMEHTQALYKAGIGFFPVRGNHEPSQTAALEIPDLFPQTLGNGPNLYGASNFQSPILESQTGDSLGERLKGLSYAFDFENIRCVLIDQFIRADGTNYDGTTSYNNNALDQLEWVDEMLSSNSLNRHSFVFTHKNLIGQNHKDNLFGQNLTSNSGARDEFITSLYNNAAGYYISGHDHMHNRSIVKSSDGESGVNQLICSSNSYKFYIPKSGDDGREIALTQELFTIGYYIFTIDGPRITVDFYSSSHGDDYGNISLVTCPSLTFYLRESFGYSLNGSQFEIAQGGSYTDITDSYQGTTASILSGQNNNTETDYLSRDLTKIINTGWSDTSGISDATGNVLTLWGLKDNLSLYNQNLEGLLPDSIESQETDVYTLSMSYPSKTNKDSKIKSGKFILAARDTSTGKWKNAVDLNYGGNKNFIYGPWNSEYGLGTYGVDPSTSSVWAVINHESDFVAKWLNGSVGCR
ncbi:MAG: metallophosphoesterase [Desulfobacteraceae bacterium]|jgi:hypothetical protein